MEEHVGKSTNGGDTQNHTVNTGGGAAIGGDVSANLFVGRDYNTFFGDPPPTFEEYPVAQEGPIILRPQLAEGLAAQLAKQRLLIVEKSAVIDTETLAIQLVRAFYHYLATSPIQVTHASVSSPRIPPCKRWSDDALSPLLLQHFRKEQPAEATDTLYLVIDAAPAILNAVRLSWLQRVLEEQNQYLLLVTTLPETEWNLLAINREYWRSLPLNCYDTAYLTEELMQAFSQRNELPPALVRTLPHDQVADDYSVRQCATDLGYPANIHLFVALLVNQYSTAETVTATEVRALQEEVTRHDLAWTVHYFFEQLSTDKEKILAIGLCFFGGVTETHFINSLERFMQGPWRYLFKSTAVLDRLHVNQLHTLLKIEDDHVKQQYPEQIKALFATVWHEYRYHMLKVLPLCIPLIVESAEPHLPRTKNRAADQTLRLTIAQALGLMGVRSPIEIEKTVLQLATHSNWGVQLAAARALAVWYGEPEGRSKCMALITRWLQREWPPGIRKDEINGEHVDLTIARFLNEMMRSTPTLFDEQLLHLTYKVFLNGYEQPLAYLVEILFPKLPTESLETIEKIWHGEPIMEGAGGRDLEKAFPAAMRSVVALACALLRRGVGIPIGEPLLQELHIATNEYRVVSANTLRYINELVVQLWEQPITDREQLLLRLSRVINPHDKLLMILHQHVQPDDRAQLLAFLEHWRTAYLNDQHKGETYQKGDKYAIHFWTVTLPSIALIYETNGEFTRFEEWLHIWFQENRSYYRWRIVEVLVAIHRQQSTGDSVEPEAENAAKPPSQTLTPMETMLTGWLADCTVDAPVNQVAFLFYVEQSERSIAVAALDHMGPLGLGLTPWLLLPFHAGYRRAFFHIRPMSNKIADVDSERWHQIMYRWSSLTQGLGYLAFCLWVARQNWRVRQGLIDFVDGLVDFFVELPSLSRRLVTWPYRTVRSFREYVANQLRLATKD